MAWDAAETPTALSPHEAHVPAQPGLGTGHAQGAVPHSEFQLQAEVRSPPCLPSGPFDPVVCLSLRAFSEPGGAVGGRHTAREERHPSLPREHPCGHPGPGALLLHVP